MIGDLIYLVKIVVKLLILIFKIYICGKYVIISVSNVN